MKRITVSLSYPGTGYLTPTGASGGPGSGVVFPVKVIDADGALLDKGVVSVDAPARLAVPDTVDLAFVRLTWPSGHRETRRVPLDAEDEAKLVFDDHLFGANEWSAWAVPRLNPRTPMLGSMGNLDLDLDKFSQVWLRLWKFADGAWRLQNLAPTQARRNGSVWQLDLTLAACPWLLQVGGTQVPWRFIALPGDGAARVLLTPRDSHDPRADPLKVVVTGFRPDAETLLEFLARDVLGAADAIAVSPELAPRLFGDPSGDPVSGVAGAYYLLRTGRWQDYGVPWFRRLYEASSWLADSAIVYCLRRLRAGLGNDEDERDVRRLFAECLARGWPVFAEGATLLHEAAALLRGGAGQDDPDPFELAEALGAAKAWAGSVNSFYGRYPDVPGAIKWVGMPAAPRYLKRPAAFWSKGLDSHGSSVSLGLSDTAGDEIHRPHARRSRTGDDKRPESEEFLLGSISK
jgi:hypothetical protein